MILDPNDQRLARDSAVGATVVLLKQARTLLESIDPHGFAFKAEAAVQS